MASILPNQILPIDAPAIDLRTGKFMQNWWLLIYNLVANVLGNQNATSAAMSVAVLGDVALDAATTDPLPLWNRVYALENSQIEPEQYASLLAVAEALQTAQEPLLQDVTPRAQPVQSVVLTGSPFAYTAPFDGTVIVTGGTVSAQTLTRQGTAVTYTGSVIPVSRLDQVSITYTGSPTMSFIPR